MDVRPGASNVSFLIRSKGFDSKHPNCILADACHVLELDRRSLARHIACTHIAILRLLRSLLVIQRREQTFSAPHNETYCTETRVMASLWSCRGATAFVVTLAVLARLAVGLHPYSGTPPELQVLNSRYEARVLFRTAMHWFLIDFCGSPRHGCKAGLWGLRGATALDGAHYPHSCLTMVRYRFSAQVFRAS